MSKRSAKDWVMPVFRETPTYEIVMPYPPSANRYWRHSARKSGSGVIVRISSEALQYRAFVQAQLLLMRPLECRLKVVIRSTPKTVRADVHNNPKVLLDVLQGRVYKDDNQIVDCRTYVVGYDFAEPKIVLEVYEEIPQIVRKHGA